MPRACQRNRRSRKTQRNAASCDPATSSPGTAARDADPRSGRRAGGWCGQGHERSDFAFRPENLSGLHRVIGNWARVVTGMFFLGNDFFEGEGGRDGSRGREPVSLRARTSANILSAAVPNENGRMGPIRARLDRSICCGQECPRSALVQGHKSQTLCARGVSPRTASNKTAILTSRRTRHQSAR